MRLDVCALDRPIGLDLAAPRLLALGDARFRQRLFLRDPRPFHRLACDDLSLIDGGASLDFALAHRPLRCDARLAYRLLLQDACAFDLLLRGSLRLFGLGLTQRPLTRQLGSLHGAPDLHVALLFEPRRLALPLDLERLFLGLQVAGADADQRILFDVVAELAPSLDLLDRRGQAFGVEAVRRVEIRQVGLVEVGDRHRFEFEAVLRQRLRRCRLHARHVVAAPLVHLLHRHLGGDRAQRGNKLAGQQRVQLQRLHGSAAEGRGGDGNRLPRRAHAHVKLGLDVDADAVAGDDRVLLRAHHRHLQHVHVDRRYVVDERQHEGTAVDHHPLAEQAGAHERYLLGRTAVQPVYEVDDDRNRNRQDNEPKDQRADELHGRAPQRRRWC